jgi:hypothetical protein
MMALATVTFAGGVPQFTLSVPGAFKVMAPIRKIVPVVLWGTLPAAKNAMPTKPDELTKLQLNW